MVTRQDFRLDSGGITLAATLFVPPGEGPHPALVICHGMPAGPRPDPGASDGGRRPSRNRGKPTKSAETQYTGITAAILDHLGIAPPPPMTSSSLVQRILGREEKVRDFAVWRHFRKSLNIRHGDWICH